MFSFRKMHLKMSSETWQPFCLSLYVLKNIHGGHCENWSFLGSLKKSTVFYLWPCVQKGFSCYIRLLKWDPTLPLWHHSACHLRHLSLKYTKTYSFEFIFFYSDVLLSTVAHHGTYITHYNFGLIWPFGVFVEVIYIVFFPLVFTCCIFRSFSSNTSGVSTNRCKSIHGSWNNFIRR